MSEIIVSSDSDSPKERIEKNGRCVDTLLLKVSDEELAARKKFDKNKELDTFGAQNVKCTRCQQNLSFAVSKGSEFPVHPILGVPFCKDCCKYYGDGYFSLDEDEEEKYCRWCGEGGEINYCSKCIGGICSKCIKRNLGRTTLSDIKHDDNWVCLLCEPKPIWRLRYIASVLVSQANEKRVKQKKKREGRLFRLRKRMTTRNADDSSSVADSESGTSQDTSKPGRSTSEKDKSAAGIDASSVKLLKFLRTNTVLCLKRIDSLLQASKSVEDDESCKKFSKKMKSFDSVLELFDGFVQHAKSVRGKGESSKASPNKDIPDDGLHEMSEGEGTKDIEKAEESNDKDEDRGKNVPDSAEIVPSTSENNEVLEEASNNQEKDKAENEAKANSEAENQSEAVEQGETSHGEKSAGEKTNETENSEPKKDDRNSEEIETMEYNVVTDSDSSSVKDKEHAIAKNLALKSSSSDSEKDQDKGKLSQSDTTDSDNSGKEKTPRKRVRRKRKSDGSSRNKNNDEDDEMKSIKRLTNLKSLKRQLKSQIRSSSEESVVSISKTKETSETKSRSTKAKTDKLEQKLTDIANEYLSKSSGEESAGEKTEDNNEDFSNFFKSNKSLYKGVVLATSSDESEKLSDEIAIVKSVVKASSSRKRTKSDMSDNSSEEDSHVKKKRRLSSGISESSDDEIEESKSKKKGNTKKETKKRKKKGKQENDNKAEKKGKNWKRISKNNISSDSSDSDVVELTPKSNKGRKNIMKIMKKDALQVETRQAVKLEEERKKRLKKRQQLFDTLFSKDDKRLILDFNEKGEVLLSVSQRLVKKLKPHQKDGVKFMWENCFESLTAMETSNGGGCILAHCMGLGKTLQVVTLTHTLLTQDIGVNTVLVICPLNTCANWVNEFNQWLAVANCDTIDIYDLNKYKRPIERKHQLQTWHDGGGVMIISYDMFRNLTKENNKMEAIRKCLVRPGPDLAVCDEGHLLKNSKSVLSACVSKIQSERRIVLTGTPLQNNLMEYHCMVNFIKPNILGTAKEFMNMFVNPIENGQFEDSTELDVRIMKRRSHVLHTMLDGCIQRFDYSVLTPFLPTKHEYVISIALSEPLSKLYRHYIENCSNKGTGGKTSGLFHDFHMLQRVWTHPLCMQAQHEQDIERKSKISHLEKMEEFINDNSDSSSNDSSVESVKSDGSSGSIVALNENGKGRRTRSNKVNGDVEEERPPSPQKPWWDGLIDENIAEEENISNKLVLLFTILSEAELVGDKVLLFSQSLYSLDLIEHFLMQRHQNGENWELNYNYFRLDGSTSSEKREIWCKAFNRPTNTNAKLFLISTKAGGLGINLVGANRVIIFDASWNPSHDLQSIFRIYRFGQEKICFIYRFLAEATMEEKIYKRQVTKLSLAHRVVDEHQIERHYSMGNLQELYNYDPLPPEEWKTPNVPKDDILALVLKKHKDAIVGYHEHDSLLENKEEEELTEEERKAAWDEYEISHTKQDGPLVGFQQVPPYLNNAVHANLPRDILADMKQYMALNAAASVMAYSRQNVNPGPRLPQIPAMTVRPNFSGTLRNPFANSSNDPLQTMSPTELLKLGQRLKVLPEEGETHHDYRKRLSLLMK